MSATPHTEVHVFRQEDGEIPLLDWLNQLEKSKPKVYAKCLARILELEEKGSQMRRPHADYLENGIYELRASFGTSHYRILYFFYGRNLVVLSHGLDKKVKVPAQEIAQAVARMKLVKRDPKRHIAELKIE